MDVSRGMLLQMGKPEGRIVEVYPPELDLEWSYSIEGLEWFTSHIFLALKNDKCVTSVWFLLLIRLLVSMSINNNANLEKQVSFES